MNKIQKKDMIQKIINISNQSTGFFVINFNNLETSEIISLKKKLQPMQGNISIFKNTLLRLAAENDVSLKKLLDSFNKQIALVHFSEKDIFQPSKTLAIFLEKNTEKISFKTGMIESTIINFDKFQKIAQINSLVQLKSQLCGVLKNPMISLIMLLKVIAEKNNIN